MSDHTGIRNLWQGGHPAANPLFFSLHAPKGVVSHTCTPPWARYHITHKSSYRRADCSHQKGSLASGLICVDPGLHAVIVTWVSSAVQVHNQWMLTHEKDNKCLKCTSNETHLFGCICRSCSTPGRIGFHSWYVKYASETHACSDSGNSMGQGNEYASVADSQLLMQFGGCKRAALMAPTSEP